MGERVDGRTLIAWDTHCEMYLPASEIGQGCPWMDNGGGSPHTLRRRRAFLCPKCGDCYFDGSAFIEHLSEYMTPHEGNY